MVIDGSDTTRTHTKTFSVTVHNIVRKGKKKDLKGTLYSSHSKCKFEEIAVDSKKAETIGNFSSYQTLKFDENL